MALVGPQHVRQSGMQVQLDDGTQLDLGAVAKGYAGQRCADALEDQGVAAILTLGGNVQTVGRKPDGTDWQVGIADPDAPETSCCTAAARDKFHRYLRRLSALFYRKTANATIIFKTLPPVARRTVAWLL